MGEPAPSSHKPLVYINTAKIYITPDCDEDEPVSEPAHLDIIDNPPAKKSRVDEESESESSDEEDSEEQLVGIKHRVIGENLLEEESASYIVCVNPGESVVQALQRNLTKQKEMAARSTNTLHAMSEVLSEMAASLFPRAPIGRPPSPLVLMSESDPESATTDQAQAEPEHENEQAEGQNEQAEAVQAEPEDENEQAEGQNEQTEAVQAEPEDKNEQAEGQNEQAEAVQAEPQGDNEQAEGQNEQAAANEDAEKDVK